uniref:Uncharacterized protein n=1 Tax=Heterorhabditis bacteriophora TaxID=37862 RepID=A0A1I7WR66_HETBA
MRCLITYAITMFLSLLFLLFLNCVVAHPYGIARDPSSVVLPQPIVRTFSVLFPPRHNSPHNPNVRPGYDHSAFNDVFDGLIPQYPRLGYSTGYAYHCIMYSGINSKNYRKTSIPFYIKISGNKSNNKFLKLIFFIQKCLEFCSILIKTGTMLLVFMHNCSYCVEARSTYSDCFDNVIECAYRDPSSLILCLNVYEKAESSMIQHSVRCLSYAEFYIPDQTIKEVTDIFATGEKSNKWSLK